MLGKGKWQLQLHGSQARDREDGRTVRTTETAGQLAYGLREDADLQLDLPYFREVTGGDAVEGRGDLALAYKWRFHESDKLKLVVKPAISLPTGRDELALGTGRASWSADVVAAHQARARLELLGHLRYDRNRNRIGERAPLWHVSAAALWKATEQLKLVVDVAQETNPNPQGGSSIREIVYGLIYELADAVDLGLGLKKGLNGAADDHALLAGIKLRW